MNINGATVTYGDGIKTADYAPPRTVSIAANVDLAGVPNPEAALQQVLDMLKRRAHETLHSRAAPVPEAAPEEEAPQGETQRRTRRAKAQIAEDEAKALTGANGGGETSAEFPEAPAAEAPADEWDTPPVAVTDEALIKAITEKNGALQASGMTAEAAPVLIRALIASYNPDPTQTFGIKNIPAEQRADFLAKLAKIGPPKKAA